MRQTDTAKTEKTGGVAGKFKNLFAGAKQKMDKLDGKLGVVSEPQVTPESSAVAEVQLESEAATPGVEVSHEVDVQTLQDSEVKASGGMGGKLKNLFGSAKKTEAEPVANAAPLTAVAEAVEEAIVEAAPATAGEKAAAPGKIKGLFGKFKRNT